MHTGTGEIKVFKEGEEIKSPWVKMNIPVTNRQMRRNPKKVGRNEPCGCGSGTKFKYCCWSG